MKFRCAYCKQLLGEKPVATCPHCRKTMRIPDEWLLKDCRHRPRLPSRPREDRSRAGRWGPAGVRSPATLLMVLAVMTLVGGMTAVRALSRPSWRTQPIAMARRHLQVLRIALDYFRADCGQYPTTEEGLDALVKNPGHPEWSGPYVNWIRPDPWQHPYQYACVNGQVTLFSCGPDGQPGTADDLSAPPR